jgi:hypothetical protein
MEWFDIMSLFSIFILPSASWILVLLFSMMAGFIGGGKFGGCRFERFARQDLFDDGHVLECP